MSGSGLGGQIDHFCLCKEVFFVLKLSVFIKERTRNPLYISKEKEFIFFSFLQRKMCPYQRMAWLAAQKLSTLFSSPAVSQTDSDPFIKQAWVSILNLKLDISGWVWVALQQIWLAQLGVGWVACMTQPKPNLYFNQLGKFQPKPTIRGSVRNCHMIKAIIGMGLSSCFGPSLTENYKNVGPAPDHFTNGILKFKSGNRRTAHPASKPPNQNQFRPSPWSHICP